MGRPPISEENAGILYATGAYTVWGLMPLYWRLLRDISPFELTVHRVLWCAIVVAVALLAHGHFGKIIAIVRTPRTLGTLVVTSALITFNWEIYMYAFFTDRLVEAALGYYLTPLISFALGIAFFGERLSRLRLGCIVLAIVGVVVQVVAFGRLPWLALGLAASFGLYGYLRKRVPVASLPGLLIETSLLLPVSAGLVVWWHGQGTGAFLSGGLGRDGLLILGGALTALPLALFAAGVRRVRMTTMGFLQYLGPSLSLMLAVFVFGEPFSHIDLATFACVWTAIIIVSLDGWTTKPPAPVGVA